MKRALYIYFVLTVVIVGFGGKAVWAESLTYYPVDFSTCHNSEFMLHTSYGCPVGNVVFGGVPFYIPETGQNYWNSRNTPGGNGSGLRSIEFPVNVESVSVVHTLVNTSWGASGGPFTWIEFFGSDGAYYRKDLYGGVDIRDWSHNSWCNTINGTTTINVWNNGGSGSSLQRLDKQAIHLPSEFQGQTLETIRFSDNGNGEYHHRAFLAGVTVGQDHSPKPDIDVSPLFHEFWNVWVGTSSSPTNVTISNVGEANLIISKINVTSSVFSFDAVDLPITVAAGSSVKISVSFSPSDTVMYFDLLTICSNDPDESQVTIGLMGHGVRPLVLFREKKSFNYGWDHCAFHSGLKDVVWEAHPGYTDGSYYDPYEKVTVLVPYDPGVQNVYNQHTLGSFEWCSANHDESPVIDTDRVAIDPEIAKGMLSYFVNYENADYFDIDKWWYPGGHKGTERTFSCVGFIEAAAESVSGFNQEQGFIPNELETFTVEIGGFPLEVSVLTPGLLKYCLLNSSIVWSVRNVLAGSFDPVDFILTDSLGQRLGHLSGVGTFEEIPNAYYSGDGDREDFVIPNPATGPYHLELYGVGEDYRCFVEMRNGTGDYSWSRTGYLHAGKKVTQILFPEWKVFPALPRSKASKAGRTIPVKFSIREAGNINSATPFVYSENLKIRIYNTLEPSTVLQTATHGNNATDYRIDTEEETYITNFKTGESPAKYQVEIWKPGLPFPFAYFTFETMR